MKKADVQPITRLLHSAGEGDEQALNALYDAVYPVLYRMAASRPGVSENVTLTPTVVISELFLKIAESTVLNSNDRQHFYATRARAMRFIIADFARNALAAKRGGNVEQCPYTTALAGQPDRAQQLLDIDSAMADLELVDRRLRELVELKFFGGLTHIEIGRLYQRSERSIKRDWVRARAFLVARSGMPA